MAMRRALIAAAAALITLAACSSGDDGSEAQSPTTVGALEAAGIPPEPDQITADAYIAALDAIDPGIVRDNPESAIDRGRNQCSSIKANPGDRASLIDSTNQRFTSPEHPEGWGPEIAEQILDVVHRHLCPSF